MAAALARLGDAASRAHGFAGDLIRRAARVEEVANMILYASSEQASATTGAALRVDGGVVDSIV